MFFWKKKTESKVIENTSEDALIFFSPEKTVTTNTILKVKEGYTAVFRYVNQEITFHDYIRGPFDRKMEIIDLPVYTHFGKASLPAAANILFINREKTTQVKFSNTNFVVEGEGGSIPTKMKGTIRFRISDCRNFTRKQAKHIPTETMLKEELAMKTADFVCSYLETFPKDNRINPLSLNKKTATVSRLIEPSLKNYLSEKYGIEVLFAEISAIGFDLSSDGYAYFSAKRKRLRQQKTEQ